MSDATMDMVRPADELARSAAVAAAMRSKAQRRVRNDFLKTLALVVAVPLVASGWIARAVSPEVRQEIEYVPLAPDGTIASAFRWEALDPRVRGDAVINTLWNYVRHREAYSATGVDYAWRVVTALSEPKVGDEYKAANDPRNAESPFAKFGEKTRVDVAYDSHWDLCPVSGCPDEAEGYAFRFWRTEVVDGVPRQPVMHLAQLRFRRDVPGIDARQRATINGPAIQVREYVPGRPAGAQRGAGSR